MLLVEFYVKLQTLESLSLGLCFLGLFRVLVTFVFQRHATSRSVGDISLKSSQVTSRGGCLQTKIVTFREQGQGH